MALWGKTDAVGSIPTWLESDANNTNKSNDKDLCVFLDLAEAQVAGNRDIGLKTPGWNIYTTYVNANGDTRRIIEPLVAMKVSASDAGDNDSIANS